MSVNNFNSNGMLPRMPEDPTGYMMAPNSGDDWQEEDSINLQQLLGVLIRRRKIIAVTFLSVVILVGLYTWSVKPVYQATASILVDTTASPASTAMGQAAGQLPVLADLSGLTQARSTDTQIEIVKSAPIIRGAYDRLSPEYQKALGKIQQVIPNVNVQAVKQTDVISVSASSHSPQAAAALSNAICDSYIQENLTGNRQQTRAAADYVSRQLQEVKQKLDKAGTALRNYKQKNATVDLVTESQQKVTQIATMESNLQQAEAERSANIAQVNALQGIVNKMSPSLEMGSTKAISPRVNEIKSQLTQLEMDRAKTLQEYTPNSPEVRAIDKQIANVRQRLSNQAVMEVQSKTLGVNPVRQTMATNLATAQGQLWAMDSRVGALKSAEGQLRSELSKLPEKEYQLANLTTDLQVTQQTYQMLNQQYQSLRISEEARMANARILAPADIPIAPIKPKKAMNMAMAVVLGIMLAAGIAALVDRLDDRVHSEDDVQAITSRPVLGHVPFIKEVGERTLISNKKKNSALLESFRMMRNNISLSMIDEPIHSVMFTSSEPNEGKSHTSLNLAVAMAMDGKKVILVEGDLRRPSVHKVLGMSNEVGLTNLISGKVSLDEVLQQTPVSGLKILASGPLPPNPPELLNSRACRAAIKQVMEAADFVVIDTPPGLAMADAQIIATQVDATIVVISANEAHKSMVARLANMLNQAGNQFLGVVINKLGSDGGGYYGYYGYHGYHYYSQSHYSNYESTPEIGDGKKSSRTEKLH